MRLTKSIMILAVSLLMIQTNCKKEQVSSTVPCTGNGFHVFTSIHSNLNIPGNYEYFNEGYAGVFLYRINTEGVSSDFYAFDRACPYDYSNGGQVSYTSFPYLTCSLCGTKYDFTNNGFSTNNKNLQLRPYTATNIADNEWFFSCSN